MLECRGCFLMNGNALPGGKTGPSAMALDSLSKRASSKVDPLTASWSLVAQGPQQAASCKARTSESVDRSPGGRGGNLERDPPAQEQKMQHQPALAARLAIWALRWVARAHTRTHTHTHSTTSLPAYLVVSGPFSSACRCASQHRPLHSGEGS